MATQTEEPKREFSLDDVLAEIGSSGPFHIRIYCLLLVPVIMFSMYDMSYLFTSAGLEYRWEIVTYHVGGRIQMLYSEV